LEDVIGLVKSFKILVTQQTEEAYMRPYDDDDDDDDGGEI
jgi:hypothetical protein